MCLCVHLEAFAFIHKFIGHTYTLKATLTYKCDFFPTENNFKFFCCEILICLKFIIYYNLYNFFLKAILVGLVSLVALDNAGESPVLPGFLNKLTFLPEIGPHHRVLLIEQQYNKLFSFCLTNVCILYYILLTYVCILYCMHITVILNYISISILNL